MDKVPVFVLTGFLGAGKSILLNRLLQDPAYADTAIIINEFGDVALDHDLMRVGSTQVARTITGCLCCTRGGDVRATLYERAVMRDAGDIAFARVVIETTGLADPAPLVNRLTPGVPRRSGCRTIWWRGPSHSRAWSRRSAPPAAMRQSTAIWRQPNRSPSPTAAALSLGATRPSRAASGRKS